MEIELAAETIFHIGPLPITNTLIVSWVTILLLFFLSFFATRKISKIPSGLQNIFELIIDAVYNLIEDLAHSRVKIFFPIVMTFFLFILTANWLGLLPGFGTIGFWETKPLTVAEEKTELATETPAEKAAETKIIEETSTPIHQTANQEIKEEVAKETENVKEEQVFVPLFRSINADLNMTLALAIISLVATHFFSIRILGFKNYLGHWLSFNPIFLFVGMIEIVGEFTKMVSLSFRLFGNIFAGEVVLATVAGIFAFVAPLPFYFLEIIVGVVQAAVFMMLTMVFMVLLTEKHAEEH